MRKKAEKKGVKFADKEGGDYAFEKDGDGEKDANDDGVGDAEANIDEDQQRGQGRAAKIYSGKKRAFGQTSMSKGRDASKGATKRDVMKRRKTK